MPRRSFLSRSKRLFARLVGAPRRSSTNHRSNATKENDDDSATVTSFDDHCLQQQQQQQQQQQKPTNKIVDVVKTLEASLWQLASECSVSAEQREEIYDTAHGGAVVEFAVHSMEQHVANAGIQAAGCLLLGNLCGPSSLETQISFHVHFADGAEAIVGALRQHPTHPLVQEYGCGAVTNLTYHSLENGTRLVQELNVVPLMVQAMTYLGDHNLAVALKSCWALYNVSAFELRHGFDAVICASGGVKILQATLARYNSDEYDCASLSAQQYEEHQDLLKYGPRVLERLVETCGIVLE